MKKTLSIFMICVILLTINSLSISSNVSAEELNSDYIELTKTLQVNDIDSSVLNKVNAIVVSDELKEKDKELFDEVMDNGTGIIVENTNISKVQEYFDVDTIPTSENNLGCYVYKNTDVTQIIPLECNILKDEESNKKITSKDYDSLLKNTKIDYNQVIDDYAALDQEDIFENLDDKTLASLQVEPAIEDSFAYNSKFVYLYRSKEKNDEKEFDKKWVKKHRN